MNTTTSHIFATTLGGVLAFLSAPEHCKGAAIASVDTFGSGADTFTIDFVDISNPGNGDDLGAGGGSYSAPYGGLGYTYRMGVTEVPQDWIAKATNLGLTNVTAEGGTANQPATFMTWYEAAAFVNFLNTTTGHQAAYQIDPGVTALTLWSSAQAWQGDGENLYRHKDAYYFLPSEEEWYKAAYHKNDGVTANYWDYATGSNTIPTPVASGTEAGTVVYDQPWEQGPATVDNNGGLSPYGTRGQNGNAIELLESAFTGPNDDPYKDRVRRGGPWVFGRENLHPGSHAQHNPSDQFFAVGFRVASVPESSAAMLMIGSGLMLLLKRRRASAV